MAVSTTRALTSSPIATTPLPLFANCPPIFVLPTRLDLETLHSIEEELTRHAASLTYDISEARIVLGTIVQRKRAALELRTRGVWTEEVLPVPVATVKEAGEPPLKRRRIGLDFKEAGQEILDLRTESESERGSPKEKLRRLSRSSKSTETDDGQEPIFQEQKNTDLFQEGHIKVLKLEWVAQSIKAGKALPLDPFVIYHGKITARPEDLQTSKAKLKTTTSTLHQSESIITRAIQDAASQPAAVPNPYSSKFGPRRSKQPQGSQASQSHPPPTLYRQTTSEHDQSIPIPPAPEWVKDGVLYACMHSAPSHPPNEQFINQLVKIRTVRELTLDQIGVRAYSTSIAAIAAYPYEIRSPVEILSLPGCDAKIANLFMEYRNNADGTLEAAAVLDKDPAISIIYQFYRIWGVGAKTAREFYYQRQWRDLEDLIEHGWNSLSRVQQIGLKFYDEFLAGIPRSEVTDIAKIIHKHAHLVRPGCDYDGQGIECIVVGGYRRGKEVSGDIDLLLSHRDERVTKNLIIDIVSSLENEGWITHTLVLHMTTSSREQQTLPFRGDPGAHHFDSLDKALVVWQDPYFDDKSVTNTAENPVEDTEQAKRRRNPNPHRRVDIIISPWRTVGCAVLGWSGDTTFERDLRRYAKKAHGWKFDSSGVRERTSGGNVIDLEKGGTTWEERERLVMEGLGVGWRPASERCTR
ncbi:putative terminal deoxynucleotidyl transferase [Talaromyces proteolyticus]|uniref:Terminal deoxynucleotidyl transferase n=1 Tax=Talaromyces proteolyticus TaxID=1131652 RepID=A0AAD4KNX3_9EURO|nr:putative terminal deoxynucleotidyl transferase [Talaromyces proteolyticus]KAH8696055.1 putative terminal deoxynucleotidyl transferase [Talaromyces proteolyticus]